MKDIIHKAVDGDLKLLGISVVSFETMEVGSRTVIDFFDKDNEFICAIVFDVFIFSHDFLRAYFGETFLCMACGKKIIDNCSHFEKGVEHKPAWQYHGFHQLLSKDRLEYLRRFK